MAFQEFLRLLVGWLVGGSAMFGIPFMLVLVVDSGARRLMRLAHPLSAAILSLIGTGFAAAVVYGWAAWPIQVNRGHFGSPVLIAISALYFSSLVMLSVSSSRWNFEGPQMKRYFPGLHDRIEISSDDDRREKRKREYELGRYWFTRWAAVATGYVLAAEFFYLTFAYGRFSNTELEAFGFGIALGAFTAAFVCLRCCRRGYARSRALNLALQELQRPSDEPLRKAHSRRDELPVLLGREARRLIRTLRFSGGSGNRADVFVLLGSARFLGEYSRSSRSLDADLPEDVRSVLEDLTVALSNPSRAVAMIALGSKVGAFGADCRPDPDLEMMRPEGLEGRIQRIQPTVRGLIPIVVLALLIFATLFAMLGITAVDWPLI
ncbi:hypothetical protein [Glycomyces sp. NPDC047010]|uniref:hypothetical protein n=1 Tax=Glycomyces sp. NPDC047010 TaxID=3155023 RepID=UPI0033CD1571